MKNSPDLLDMAGLRRAVVDLLARRDYSHRELIRKLGVRAKNIDDLECVLADMQQRQWQSDERFAQSYFNHRVQSGIGPLRLQQELREKGVEDHVISELFSHNESDWFQQANQVARKKYATLKSADPNKQQKLYRFLVYRGFSSEHITHAMDSSAYINEVLNEV